MADIHPWNVRGVKYDQPMVYGVYQSIPVALQYREYSIELSAPANVSPEFVWNTIKEVPAMVQALREFCTRVEAGEVRSRRTYGAFKEIINRIDGVAT